VCESAGAPQKMYSRLRSPLLCTWIFTRATLSQRGISYGPVSVRPSVSLSAQAHIVSRQYMSDVSHIHVLHCLPVPQWIQIAFLAFNCVRAAGPACFQWQISGSADLCSTGTWRSGRAENSNGTPQTKFHRCRCGHLEQSSATFALVLHLQRTVSAWIETQLFQQAYNLGEHSVEECIQLN